MSDPTAGAAPTTTSRPPAGPRGTGRVLSREGWPVEGASVTVLAADGSQAGRAVTTADGTFVLDVSAGAGAATLLVAAPAHEPRAASVDVPAGGDWALGEVRLRRQGGSDTPPPGRWVVDPVHSTVSATAHHLGLSAVHGRFTSFEGVVTVAPDVSASTVEVSIDATSIDTGNAQRDEHLRAADFLDVATHPRIAFTGSGVRRAGEEWLLDGQLTLLDTTRPVTLRMRYTGSGPDPWGGTRAGFAATTELSRDDFRMNWNQAVGIGVAVFGTTLKVAIDVQVVREG